MVQCVAGAGTAAGRCRRVPRRRLPPAGMDRGPRVGRRRLMTDTGQACGRAPAAGSRTAVNHARQDSNLQPSVPKTNRRLRRHPLRISYLLPAKIAGNSTICRRFRPKASRLLAAKSAYLRHIPPLWHGDCSRHHRMPPTGSPEQDHAGRSPPREDPHTCRARPSPTPYQRATFTSATGVSHPSTANPLAKSSGSSKASGDEHIASATARRTSGWTEMRRDVHGHPLHKMPHPPIHRRRAQP